MTAEFLAHRQLVKPGLQAGLGAFEVIVAAGNQLEVATAAERQRGVYRIERFLNVICQYLGSTRSPVFRTSFDGQASIALQDQISPAFQ